MDVTCLFFTLLPIRWLPACCPYVLRVNRVQTPFPETTATEPDFGMWGSKFHFPAGVGAQLLPEALPLNPLGSNSGVGGDPSSHFLWELGAYHDASRQSLSEKPWGKMRTVGVNSKQFSDDK